ncbi:hypothetical protein JW868_00275 [Candidatus Woesearchaeota archaeon]|nr:hypothetical protein [Candidatus Woesearchaeota archaeon]
MKTTTKKWTLMLVIASVFASVLLTGCKVTEINADASYCEKDSDCVPEPVCHPQNCVNKESIKQPNPALACTLQYEALAAYSAEDCMCLDNKCTNKKVWASENVDSFVECEEAGYPVMESYPRQCTTPDGRSFVEAVNETVEQDDNALDNGLIGGQRDEHGCLGPAGYTWNEDAQACVRAWELNTEELQAAEMAVNSVGAEYGMTVVEVIAAFCPGCWQVSLEKWSVDETKRYEVMIDGWKVTSTNIIDTENIDSENIID